MTDIPVTPADEAYRHQLVAPAASTAHIDPAWAERCWHLLYVGDGWVLGTGRATWPHDGRRTAVAGLNTGEVQHAARTRQPFGLGDDPDRPDVGVIHIETVKPLEQVRLVLDDPTASFGFDLLYEARFPPVATERNLIQRHGTVVTDYMNFFQSGVYSGVIAADGVERRVEKRPGFRDRGWGLRKHEGASRRGMHIFCGCELPDGSLYMLLFEKASGERVLTNGWLLGRGGVLDRVVEVEHDLVVDGRRLVEGSLHAVLASGARKAVSFQAEGRLFMEAVGYSADPARREPGLERYDLTDPEVSESLDGLYDNACRFDADGVVGHGFVEVGLGTHARYLPADDD